jgi:hypothetical protein
VSVLYRRAVVLATLDRTDEAVAAFSDRIARVEHDELPMINDAVAAARKCHAERLTP